MTDTPLSNTAAAVLGMVAAGLRSGYEIRRGVGRSVRFFWALGPPQIYAELKRLEAAGLIRGDDQPRGDRARRVFEVTAAGRRALRDWVVRDETATLELRDSDILRLFFADAAGAGAAREHVERIRRRSEAMLAHFDREILPAATRGREAGAEFPEHVARFGRELHEFIVEWCDRLHGRLATEEAA